ncbi:MAG: hypothetical protein ACOCU3_00340 [bacterium]
MMEVHKRNNFICFGLLITILIIVHYVIVLWPDVEMLQSQKALFSWPAIGIIGLLGLPGVYLLNFTGLKKLWDAGVGIKQKVFYPFAVGLLLGSIQSVYDIFTGASDKIAASMGLGDIHIDFPFSIPVYTGGAIIVCTIYYLIPISFLVYLISTRILKGKDEGTVFWSVGILIALFEPITNPGISIIQQVGAVAIPMSVFVLFFNLVSITYIRKYGFITAYFLRIGEYSVWHILYPVVF